MEPMLGVSLPVINVPGATGQVGLTKLVSGAADGYSLLVLTGDTYGLFASPKPKFIPSQVVSLGIMILQPSGFYVKQDAPWKNWKELLEAAKTKTLRVATSGFGSPDDITINYYRSRGYHFENVPYGKPGERYTSILGDHADVLYEQTGDVRSYVDSKQIRPVVLFYPKPLDVGPFKGIPVTGQEGIDIALPQMRTVIVKAGTDAAIVTRLSDDLGKVSQTPEYRKYLENQYADPDSYMPSAKANEYLKAWLAKAREIVASRRTRDSTRELQHFATTRPGVGRTFPAVPARSRAAACRRPAGHRATTRDGAHGSPSRERIAWLRARRPVESRPTRSSARAACTCTGSRSPSTSARAGRIGPDAWPRMILVLLICVPVTARGRCAAPRRAEPAGDRAEVAGGERPTPRRSAAAAPSAAAHWVSR